MSNYWRVENDIRLVGKCSWVSQKPQIHFTCDTFIQFGFQTAIQMEWH